MWPFSHRRPGTTLVEILLFLGFFGICAGVIISVIAFSNEQRLRQQVVSAVDQEGAQLLQLLLRRVHSAERILDPTLGHTGSILALQMADETQNPTIIASQSGAIMVVQRETLQQLTSSKSVASALVVRNTSVSLSRQSIEVSFQLTRTIPLPSPISFTRTFDLTASLFPSDEPTGGQCGCPAPLCEAGVYRWNVCTNDICADATITLACF
ncbi:MAG: hypothetical protein PHH13_05385 [Candidatus Peribacteraceae bacterium]|nr:hypothetical protein [Candidatus Peribacteraceae bacterium]